MVGQLHSAHCSAVFQIFHTQSLLVALSSIWSSNQSMPVFPDCTMVDVCWCMACISLAGNSHHLASSQCATVSACVLSRSSDRMQLHKANVLAGKKHRVVHLQSTHLIVRWSCELTQQITCQWTYPYPRSTRQVCVSVFVFMSACPPACLPPACLFVCLCMSDCKWLQYRMPACQPVRLFSYAITSANDCPERDPSSW